MQRVKSVRATIDRGPFVHRNVRISMATVVTIAAFLA
jgi:hypothetical protein